MSLAPPALPYARPIDVQNTLDTPGDGSSVASLNITESSSVFEGDISVDLPDELAQFRAVISQLGVLLSVRLSRA